MAGEPVEYELRLPPGADAADVVEAELSSPQLDPVLHTGGSVRVNIYTDSVGRKPNRKYVLDSFHTESIADYLRSQRAVRETLEAELPRDRDQWDPGGKAGRGRDLWSAVKVVSVDVRRRKVLNPLRLESLKKVLSGEQLEGELAAFDGPEVRSSFTVVVEVPWDDEHQLKAEFRNGTFRRIKHE